MYNYFEYNFVFYLLLLLWGCPQFTPNLAMIMSGSWSSCRNKSCMGHMSASSLLLPAIYDLCSENVHRVEWALVHKTTFEVKKWNFNFIIFEKERGKVNQLTWYGERNLKAYSQISNRGRSQKFQNLNFLYLFITLPLKTHSPKGIEQKSFQGEIRAIFP